jgi:hypothetical protein
MESYPITLGMGTDSICSGTETFFSDCYLDGVFTDTWSERCTHEEDLGVVCVVDDTVHTAYPTGTLDIEDCVTDDFTGYTTGGLIIYV